MSAKNAAPRKQIRPVMNYILWTVQVLLSLTFLFAGGLKLVLSPEALASMGPPNQVQLPGTFLQLIGVFEVLGATGLVLPWLLRIRPALTPLAAAGLVIIMIGATVVTIASGQIAGAIVPFVVGLLATFVAYGRWGMTPQPSRRSRVNLSEYSNV